MYEQLQFDFKVGRPESPLALALSGWQGNALPFIEAVQKRIEEGETEADAVRLEVARLRGWSKTLMEKFDA
jgi:hypothetical protein